MKIPALNSVRWYVPLLLAAVTLTFPIRGSVQASPAAQEAKERPFVVEYYYKAKWGMRKNSSRCSRKITIHCLRKKWNWGGY
jgi:hypothetical protein